MHKLLLVAFVILIIGDFFGSKTVSADLQHPQLSRSTLLAAYEPDGTMLWRYDYLTPPTALITLEEYFSIIAPRPLSEEEKILVGNEVFVANMCKFWRGDWLVSKTVNLPDIQVTAAPKPFQGYPPQTGWSYQLPVLQPVTFTLANLFLKVPNVYLATQNNNELGQLTMQWLLKGNVLFSKKISPTPVDSISEGDSSQELYRTFHLSDQKVEMPHEDNYSLRIIHSPDLQTTSGETNTSIDPLNITERVIAFGACSAEANLQ